MTIKRWIVISLALIGAGSALAQEARPVGVLVRLGKFFPSALQARNAGKDWFLFGVQVDIGKAPILTTAKRSSLALSVDTMQKGDLSATPVLINVVTHEGQMIFSAGVGASWDREARQTQAGLEKKNRLEFAWQLGMGYDLAKFKVPAQIELRYLGNGYDTLSGFAVCLGVRF